MWKTFVAMGDSFAEGIGDPTAGFPSLGWADHLAAHLRAERPGLRYVNVGKRGKTAAEVHAEQLAVVLQERPGLVILSVGGNDILGGKWQPEIVAAMIDSLLGALTAARHTVVIWTLNELPLLRTLPDRQRAGAVALVEQINEIIRSKAAAHGAHVIESWEHPIAQDPENWSQDGIHANARGYFRIGERLVAELENWAPAPVTSAR